MVVPNALEGKGLVTGRVQGTRVQMSVRAVLVTVGTPAQFESGIDLTGIRNSNRIIGEITFEGGEAEYVEEATGRPVGSASTVHSSSPSSPTVISWALPGLVLATTSRFTIGEPGR